jgi:hypothetical protein
VAAAVDVVAPDGAVREYFEECDDGTLDRVEIRFKKLDVHGNGAAGVEVLLHSLQEFLDVQIRRTLHPGVQGIDRDAIELVAGGQEVVTAVVDSDLCFRIAEDIEVRLAEIRGGGMRD